MFYIEILRFKYFTISEQRTVITNGSGTVVLKLQQTTQRME